MAKPIQDLTTIPETGYLRDQQVLRFIPIGRSTWWEGVRTGRFPAGVKLGPNTTAWRVEDIRELITSFGEESHELFEEVTDV